MKILVLVPTGEQFAITALMLFSGLEKKVKNNAVAMPAYADYLVSTGLAKNWEEASLKALVSAEKVYKESEDCIIIGNISKDCGEFDLIIRYKDIEDKEPFKDKLLELLRKKAETNGEKEIEKKLTNLYKNGDEKNTMHDARATATFLSSYFDTGVKMNDKTKHF